MRELAHLLLAKLVALLDRRGRDLLLGLLPEHELRVVAARLLALFRVALAAGGREHEGDDDRREGAHPPPLPRLWPRYDAAMRPRWRAAALLACVASAAHADTWTVTAEGGAEIDSNVQRVETGPGLDTSRVATEVIRLGARLDRRGRAAGGAYALNISDLTRLVPNDEVAVENVTVLAGTLNMGMGDAFDASATKALPAGSFLVMPKGTRHFAFTTGETILQVHSIGPWGITYVNPADDPRTGKAK